MTLDFQPTSSVPVADTTHHTAYVQKCINSRLAELAKSLAPKSQKHQWRGRKRDRVRAYLRGIVRCSKHVWTWVSPRNVVRALSKDPEQTVSEKTVWRVLRDLAEREDPELRVRICQRKTRKNYHFQWMIANRKKLLFDQEPLFLRHDGKKRHLRLRCRKKDLPGTKTNAPGSFLYQQKKRDPTPLGGPAAPGALSSRVNDWKQDVPAVEQMFHVLELPIHKHGGRIWTHSPWKRTADRNPSCLIFPDENRFWDFATGQGGNAITLARIANPDRQLSFKDALLWLRSKQATTEVPLPRCSSQFAGAPGSLGQVIKKREDAAQKPPRHEKLYRLAWRIFREETRGMTMEGMKPLAVVGLIVKALEKNADRTAVADALLGAMCRRHDDAPGISFYCRENLRYLHEKRRPLYGVWRADDPRNIANAILLAQFVQDLQTSLDRAVNVPKLSPAVRRNTDAKAVSMCLAQIAAMFQDDEYIWITDNLHHRGWGRTAKFWRADVAENGVPMGSDGAWLKLNPMTERGIRNRDVSDFRHVLCEADSIPLQEQVELPKRLPYPVISAVHSGGKSIHFIVRVNATKDTYAQTVKNIHTDFPQFDQACKDPARWTRLAGACRNGVLQAAVPTKKFSDLQLATNGTSGSDIL